MGLKSRWEVGVVCLHRACQTELNQAELGQTEHGHGRGCGYGYGYG